MVTWHWYVDQSSACWGKKTTWMPLDSCFEFLPTVNYVLKGTFQRCSETKVEIFGVKSIIFSSYYSSQIHIFGWNCCVRFSSLKVHICMYPRYPKYDLTRRWIRLKSDTQTVGFKSVTHWVTDPTIWGYLPIWIVHFVASKTTFEIWCLVWTLVRFSNLLHVSQAIWTPEIMCPLKWVCFEMSEPTNGPSKNLHTVYSKNQMLLARQSWTDLPFYKTQTVDWSFLWFVGVVRSKVSPLIKRAGYLVGNTPEWFHRIGFCVAFALCT